MQMQKSLKRKEHLYKIPGYLSRDIHSAGRLKSGLKQMQKKDKIYYRRQVFYSLPAPLDRLKRASRQKAVAGKVK